MTQTKTLAELKAANLPKATFERLAESAPHLLELGDEERAKMAEYLTRYVAPSRDCVLCETVAGFTWGIVHGSGCCRCGYPARAYHYFADVLGNDKPGRMDFVLQYHPDVLEEPQPESAEEE